MQEFRFLNYHTKYSCSGSIQKRMGVEACFSKVFSEVRNDSKVRYEIIIERGVERAKTEHISNACLFQRKDIKNHIRQLKSLYPFKSRVLDKGDTFIVHLDLEGVPATFHKYILTWVRYLYEYPYNVIIKDAYRLKREPQFRFESISNLFNLVIGCFCNSPRDIHQIPRNNVTERMSKKALRAKIKEVGRLNDLYRVIGDKKNKIPNTLGEYKVTDVEYWTDDKLFNERKGIYLSVYNTIK